MFFRFVVTPDVVDVDPRYGGQEVDRGRLDDTRLSPFRATARGEPPVFRIGSRYASTEKVDLKLGTILVRAREPSEYRRLELRRGLVIPDFAFEDVDGVARRLSDFQNGHVLLFFWYPGCGPCSDEFPHLRAALNQFGSRALTILGFSESGDPHALRALLAPTGPFSVQAAPNRVRAIIEQWFGITSFPTLVLLDGHRRIVSLNQELRGRWPLRGPALLHTLHSVLPR